MDEGLRDGQAPRSVNPSITRSCRIDYYAGLTSE
jgi:hypothetical protein